MLKEPHVAFTVTHHQLRLRQVLCQVSPVLGRRQLVVAAVPRPYWAADCAQVDIPFPEPGDVVPAGAAGALAQRLARALLEGRGTVPVGQQFTVAGEGRGTVPVGQQFTVAGDSSPARADATPGPSGSRASPGSRGNT